MSLGVDVVPSTFHFVFGFGVRSTSSYSFLVGRLGLAGRSARTFHFGFGVHAAPRRIDNMVLSGRRFALTTARVFSFFLDDTTISRGGQ